MRSRILLIPCAQGIPCAHGNLNGKHLTRRERSCAGGKKENRRPKKCIQAAQLPPPPTRPQATYLLGEYCKSVLPSCSPARCSYCDNENPPPPNKARFTRREGRRAIAAQLAGREVRTCQLCIFWPRGWGAFLCSNESRLFKKRR